MLLDVHNVFVCMSAFWYVCILSAAVGVALPYEHAPHLIRFVENVGGFTYAVSSHPDCWTKRGVFYLCKLSHKAEALYFKCGPLFMGV